MEFTCPNSIRDGFELTFRRNLIYTEGKASDEVMPHNLQGEYGSIIEHDRNKPEARMTEMKKRPHTEALC